MTQAERGLNARGSGGRSAGSCWYSAQQSHLAAVYLCESDNLSSSWQDRKGTWQRGQDKADVLQALSAKVSQDNFCKRFLNSPCQPSCILLFQSDCGSLIQFKPFVNFNGNIHTQRTKKRLAAVRYAGNVNLICTPNQHRDRSNARCCSVSLLQFQLQYLFYAKVQFYIWPYTQFYTQIKLQL